MPTTSSSTEARRRRGREVSAEARRIEPAEKAFFEAVYAAYSGLVAALYNFAPMSGHPGGSLSAGRIAHALIFGGLDYDFRRPGLAEADVLSFTAGHKALGLYAMWALRNELVRIAEPQLLPPEELQLRLEDLLGFRKNPAQETPLMRRLKVRTLDGHPTPAVAFVPVATGASGVGVSTGAGLALAALDDWGADAPKVHLIEGEGGITPGRVHETLSAAATLGLANLVLHLDWNQASIDSDRVCGDESGPGDYVPWSPAELFALHDWNVVDAGDGRKIEQVLAAQRTAMSLRTGQPTAIVYRTTKGEGYGIEGRGSHGAGHPFCSDGYFNALSRFEAAFQVKLPRVAAEKKPEAVEKGFYDTLMAMRAAFEARPELAKEAAARLKSAAGRLAQAKRTRREGAPRLERLYGPDLTPAEAPSGAALEPGQPLPTRGALGKALGALNRLTGGAFVVSAADLLDSTSVSGANAGFPAGFYHARKNPGSRLIPVAGICEDAMGGLMAGVSSYGRHIGVTSSYSAFIAALEHVPARLHAIGQQAAKAATGQAGRTWIMVNAHAGPMTGEDGPTHADPQALQLLQGNFPPGSCITLTPWEPGEVWPLLIAGLKARPALLAPFVTRPATPTADRAKLGLPPAALAAEGVYAWRRADVAATVVLQGCAAATVFARDVLPKLDAEGKRLNVFYVASAELFDLLPEERRRKLFPPELAAHALGISDFTLPTLHRWVTGEEGRRRSLHPFAKGRFLGSGDWEQVVREAGLDGKSQLEAVRSWLDMLA